jgi:acyl carrier protein
MPARDRILHSIAEAIRSVLGSKGENIPEIGPETSVDRSLGLDSLDWAAVVVQLEAELGVDPFQESVSRELRTLTDLVDLYETALARQA